MERPDLATEWPPPLRGDEHGGAETVWMISGASFNAVSIIPTTDHSKLSITF